MSLPVLEICCTSIESAKIAAEGGAQRIELCDNLFEGGTTPSFGMIHQLKEKVDIDLYVLIRPRGGDFIYTADEFNIMQQDIKICAERGVDGIVSGLLTADGSVDVSRTRKLVELAGTMDFTFHRAFDLVREPEQALPDVITTGARRILTSGLQNNVLDGAIMLQNLVSLAGNNIVIMAGGGLTSGNMTAVIASTDCREFHTTAKTWVATDSTHKSLVKMNGIPGIPEDKKLIASLQEVQELRRILDEKF